MGRLSAALSLVGLLLHAATTLLLAGWLAEATGRRGLGWLAGTLFAVFPLHMEAVGWLAAQWDLWAACFGLAGLWLFTRWWRHPAVGPQLYALAVLFYGLGLFSKESLLPFLPLYAGAAWLSDRSLTRAALRRLTAALLPFAALLALNLGIRWLTWGTVGGYAGFPLVDPASIWDQLIAHLRALLSPINTTIFSPPVGQLVGALSSIGLGAALLWFGYRARHLLVLAAAWVVLLLLPVLSLGLGTADLQQNRFLYLPAAGYCVAVAALLYQAVVVMRRSRPLLLAGLALLLGAGMVTCWVQLQPWQTATLQVDALDQELTRLIPSQARPQGMVWYVYNVPGSYQGAYMLRAGLGGSRLFDAGDTPAVQPVTVTQKVSLSGDTRDVFSLRLVSDQPDAGYRVGVAAGLTAAEPPPAGTARGTGFQLWDFENCDPAALRTWLFNQKPADCAPGGLLLRPTGPDPQLLGPPLTLDTVAGGARFVRLRVLVRYPSIPHPLPYLGQWFWHGPDAGWNEDQSRAFSVVQDGTAHVYWTFLPVADVGPALAQLRFDPINAAISCQVGWIALDLVP